MIFINTGDNTTKRWLNVLNHPYDKLGKLLNVMPYLFDEDHDSFKYAAKDEVVGNFFEMSCFKARQVNNFPWLQGMISWVSFLHTGAANLTAPVNPGDDDDKSTQRRRRNPDGLRDSNLTKRAKILMKNDGSEVK